MTLAVAEDVASGGCLPGPRLLVLLLMIPINLSHSPRALSKQALCVWCCALCCGSGSESESENGSGVVFFRERSGQLIKLDLTLFSLSPLFIGDELRTTLVFFVILPKVGDIPSSLTTTSRAGEEADEIRKPIHFRVVLYSFTVCLL